MRLSRPATDKIKKARPPLAYIFLEKQPGNSRILKPQKGFTSSPSSYSTN